MTTGNAESGSGEPPAAASAGRVAGPPPPVARKVFGSRLALVERYADLLAGPGVQRGLLGPAEAGRIWERHVLNSVAVAELVPAGAFVVDLGSGAGLPGLVVGLARPDVRVCLVEPLLRRCVFLAECVQELGLTTVEVRRARAAELRGTVQADVVTARAVAPLHRLLDWSLPLVRPGGAVLAIKGERVDAEIAAAGPALARWRVARVAVHRCGAPVMAAVTVVEVVAGDDRHQRGGDAERNRTRRTDDRTRLARKSAG